MNSINVTAYRGYSQVIGELSLQQMFHLIQSGAYANKIQDIEKAMQAGDIAKADRIKRQLPFYTLTANYQMCRQAYSLKLYNDLPVLDFDDMQPEDLPRMRQLIHDDPNTVGSFLTPRRHGLKPVVYMLSEEAENLRNELQALPTVTYAQLESYHKRMYQLACHHYEDLLGTPVDTSGSDLSRGFYGSFDPDATLFTERLAAVRPLRVNLVLPEKGEASAPHAPRTHRKALEDSAIDISTIDPATQLAFSKALNYTKRKFTFKEGSRDTFINCLGTRCYQQGIAPDTALQLARHAYGNTPDFDMRTPFENGYRYTTKVDQAEEEGKKSSVEKAMEFLNGHYEFRRNLVLETLDYRKLAPPTGGDGLPASSGPFILLRLKDINSIYTRMHLNGKHCSQNMLKAIIDSDFTPDFNPFISYFHSLPPWDGVTDYIGQLADSVQTTDPAFWHDSLRRWLVALVAGAIDDNVQNQELLLLYSKQGAGKSTFIRNLVPPELKEYLSSGMINTDKTDHMMLLATRLVIHLEEMNLMPAVRLADTKRAITQDKIHERKPYDIQANNFIRRASFAGSTNNPRCLQDIGENRRILFNYIQKIDYHYSIPYKELYAQALALYRNGFHYWYEGDEITFLNQRNEHFRMREPIEENLFYYFRPAHPTEGEQKWWPASLLMSHISLNGRIQSNTQTLQTLVTVLDRNNFRRRITNNGITEYAVIEYTLDERKMNSLQPVIERQKRLDAGGDNTI